MSTSENVFRLAKKSLKRVVGAGELFSVGYGDVGSSIYYTLGATALFALGATPLAFLIAGFVFICTALTYTELSAALPESGGSAMFARHAFNDLISFIAGWGLLLDYILTLSISAFTVPPYLKHIFLLFGLEVFNTDLSHTVATISIIVFLFFINVIGLKSSARLSLILAIFTIVTQVGIVILGGLLFLNLPYVIDHLRIGVPGVSWSPDWMQFWKGTAMAMVAYIGIESMAQMSAETKRPAISIPRAIKGTMITVIFLYIGISVVGLSVISPQELGTRYLEDPVGGIAMNFPIGGQLLGPWVGLIAAVILLICANAGLIGCSRLMFSMGMRYQVPTILFKLHPRFRTPHVALAVFAIFGIIVVIASRNQMLFLADLYNFGAQIAFCSAHISLIVLRFKRADLHRPFRAPFNIPVGKGRSIPLTAIIGALATFAVWILVVITKPEGRVGGCIWMVLGLAMYFLYRKKQELPLIGPIHVEEVKVPEHKINPIKHVLVAAHTIGDTEVLQTAFELAKQHHAKITVVYVLEISESMPMDAPLKERERVGEAALKRAEAIAREYHLPIHLELVRARSVEKALLEMIDSEKHDVIVLGATRADFRKKRHVADQAEQVLKKASCRVIFCKS